jgi:hypothetical protein
MLLVVCELLTEKEIFGRERSRRTQTEPQESCGIEEQSAAHARALQKMTDRACKACHRHSAPVRRRPFFPPIVIAQATGVQWRFLPDGSEASISVGQLILRKNEKI